MVTVRRQFHIDLVTSSGSSADLLALHGMVTRRCGWTDPMVQTSVSIQIHIYIYVYIYIYIYIYILMFFLYFLTYPCKVLVIFTSFAYPVNESLWKQQMEHLSMAWRNGMYVWVLPRYSGSSPKHERVDPVSKGSRIQGMTQKSERKQQKKQHKTSTSEAWYWDKDTWMGRPQKELPNGPSNFGDLNPNL
jgi:hypothetical protein